MSIPKNTTAGQCLTLATVATVAVAMALPLLAFQREQARRARCMNNLRSIQQAMILYAEDNRDWLPALSRLDGSGSRGSAENAFERHVSLLLNLGYLSDPAVLVCPSDKEDGDPSLPFSDDGSSGHACVRVARGGPPWRPNAEPNPNIRWFNISYIYVAGLTTRDKGDFLLLADEHWASEGDCPAECRHNLVPFDNHGDTGRNVVFLDGTGMWLADIHLDEAYKSIQASHANYRTRTID